MSGASCHEISRSEASRGAGFLNAEAVDHSFLTVFRMVRLEIVEGSAAMQGTQVVWQKGLK